MREFMETAYSAINLPLDPDFLPMERWIRQYLTKAHRPVRIALTRPGCEVSVYDTFIRGGEKNRELDILHLERIIKFLLWSRGGYMVAICGADELANAIAQIYSVTGSRAFDVQFMQTVYCLPFSVRALPLDQCPEERTTFLRLGGQFNGCRIGFDAGGSDRKVSALIEGECVFSEEVIWHPKEHADPEYHFREILTALRTAASHLPKVDAVGVSSAGVFVDNLSMVSSLFIKIPKEKYDDSLRRIYLRAAGELGDIPVKVANDGDVAALAGAISLQEGRLMGIAMGTSEAAGYVNRDGQITGWLNELAFAPMDLCSSAPVDEWSGDNGCGVKYFSQDAVIRLALKAGIPLDDTLSKAQQLKEVQMLMEEGDLRAHEIYRTIGCYFGHTAVLYSRFYDICHLLLMGRVTSGRGGEVILSTAKEVIQREYPELSHLKLSLPDEKSRRVGQSVAAASLPIL